MGEETSSAEEGGEVGGREYRERERERRRRRRRG